MTYPPPHPNPLEFYVPPPWTLTELPSFLDQVLLANSEEIWPYSTPPRPALDPFLTELTNQQGWEEKCFPSLLGDVQTLPPFPPFQSLSTLVAAPYELFPTQPLPFPPSPATPLSLPTFDAAPTYKPPPVRKRRDGSPPTQRLPAYEDLIAEALREMGNEGYPPRQIFQWMEKHYIHLPSRFRGSATQALKKAWKKGRFTRHERKYKINPNYKAGPVHGRAKKGRKV